MQHPKVVILGAGSLFFGRKAIWQMVHSPHLQRGTLALVDIDAERLEKMRRLAAKVIEANESSLRLEASTDRRDVLRDADFVVLSFAVANAHFRGIDCELSANYGIRMCSGDTIGPGGVFRALREYPEIMRACQDVEQLCPDAWLINYINPTAVHGIGLMRHFPKLKSFALCDAQYDLKRNYAALTGICERKDYDEVVDRDLEILTAGPNHFTWMLKAAFGGKDCSQAIVSALRARAEAETAGATYTHSSSKAAFNDGIGVQLYDVFGCLPTVVAHTKEYVRFWQGHHKSEQKYPPLYLFEVPARLAWTDSVWKRVDDYLDEKVAIAEFDTEFGPDPATDIIENMWAGLGKRYFINTRNDGAVTNMASDNYLELYCDVDMNGPRPLPIGPMPRGIRSLCETVLDAHELTAEAIYHRDRGLLRRALLTDPLSQSIEDTDALMAELLDAESEAISIDWRVA
jgi:alpha-galactosidase